MATTLKRSATVASSADTLVDGKRRAVMDIMSMPVRNKTSSFQNDLSLQEATKSLAKVDSPRTDGEHTVFGKPSSGNSPTSTPAEQAAEARFRTAAVPPASCVCAGGSKKVVADDVYGNHYRCGDCSGMLNTTVPAVKCA